MNTDIRLEMDMLKGVSRFCLDHPITPALPRATAAIAVVNTTITELEAAAQLQIGGLGERASGVGLRESSSRELRAYLSDVNRTARTLEDHPGIAPTFRLPRSGGYAALVASAQNIIATATPLSEEFVAAGLPATFLTELGALLTAFQDATGRKNGGKISRALGTATLKAKARLGILAAQKLDACVRNHFRGQPEMIAAWKVARKIARAPVRGSSGEPTPPPGGTGSGGEGSGSGATLVAAMLNGDSKGGRLA
jgi:hypothetical protein